mgnify:CR=1 FL=1
MCGIAGVIAKPGARADEAFVLAMIERLSHRGPDGIRVERLGDAQHRVAGGLLGALPSAEQVERVGKQSRGPEFTRGRQEDRAVGVFPARDPLRGLPHGRLHGIEKGPPFAPGRARFERLDLVQGRGAGRYPVADGDGDAEVHWRVGGQRWSGWARTPVLRSTGGLVDNAGQGGLGRRC